MPGATFCTAAHLHLHALPASRLLPADEQELRANLSELRSDPLLSPSTHLLSVSIDPQYDKPAVLRAYALDVAGNTSPFDHWEFASGTPEQVRKVAEFFGLKYWTDSGQIVHALVTALIGPDGKVAQIYRGNESGNLRKFSASGRSADRLCRAAAGFMDLERRAGTVAPELAYVDESGLAE